MKTLLFHINYLLGGGIEKVMIELMWGLDPARYRVILSIGHRVDELEVLKPLLPPHVEVVYILRSPLLTHTRKRKILNTLSLPGKIYEDLVLPPFKKWIHRRVLKQLVARADIIIDFDMTLAGYTDLMQGKKTVAYCHFSFSHYWEGDKRKLDKLVRRLQRYDKVVMLCDEMKDDAIRSHPTLAHNTVRIYNALDIDRIKKLSAEPIAEYQYLLAEGYFVSVGRLAESQKDFTMLIRGYARSVQQYGITERLVIIGTGPDRPVLEALAHSLGIASKVIFTGFRENPYNLIANSRLFLFCTKFEGLPTVLIEALTLGLPVIATESPTGIAEILMHGKAGILIRPGDDAALAASISQLHDNETMKATFRNASVDILRHFEIRYMIREFERLVIAD